MKQTYELYSEKEYIYFQTTHFKSKILKRKFIEKPPFLRLVVGHEQTIALKLSNYKYRFSEN